VDFSGPSDHAFLVCFFYFYITIIFLERYNEKPKHLLTIILITLVTLLFILNSLTFSYFGNTYLIESLVGGIFGFLYTIGLLYFDSYIHELVEKTGFIVKES
jgi:membrane-associated phospholipid phosphatase